MLPEIIPADFTLGWLAVFFAVNLYNIVKVHGDGTKTKVYAEIGRPKGARVQLAAIGTLLFFFESLVFSLLSFMKPTAALRVFLLQIEFPYDFCGQIVGLALSANGYFFFIWSIVTRGKYAVS